MSLLQKFFIRILPRSWAESMEAESRTWMVRCSCGFARSIWDLEGIRWRASQSHTLSYMRCPHCGERSWHKLVRDLQGSSVPSKTCPPEFFQ